MLKSSFTSFFCYTVRHSSYYFPLSPYPLPLANFDLSLKLEENPDYTQRELPTEMAVSLSIVNYCMKKLRVTL